MRHKFSNFEFNTVFKVFNFTEFNFTEFNITEFLYTGIHSESMKHTKGKEDK